MKRLVAVAVLSCASAAFADHHAKDMKAGATNTGTTMAAQADMSKMGPWSRKPTNEGQLKKEINDFIKKEDEIAKSGDFNAMLARIDFPIYMATDSASGKTEASEYSKEKYSAMMKPMMENAPKDMKINHKPTITVMSDNMALVSDDFTMTVGKEKFAGKSAGLLVKKDGAWMWKMMSEAGWGGMDMKQPGTGGSAPVESNMKPAPATAK